jgi:hypothetical protein
MLHRALDHGDGEGDAFLPREPAIRYEEVR